MECPRLIFFFNFISKSNEDEDNQENWIWIWKLRCSQKIRLFIWLTVHGKLLTNQYKAKISVLNTDVCSRCDQQSESIIYMLRDCPKSKLV